MFALALALLLTSPAAALPPDDAAGLAFKDALLHMKAVRDRLTEYEVVFYSREWVSGAMTPLDVIAVRFREPWDIHMAWVEGPNTGRSLLYRGPEWNKGRFRIDPGPLLPVLSLHPESNLARRGGRHTIYDLPLTRLVDTFIADAMRVNDHPTWRPQVVDEGPTTVRGEPSHCYKNRLPKAEDPTLYAHEVRICVNPTTGMPNALRVWDVEDGALRLVEEYDYIGFTAAPAFDAHTFLPTTYGL